MSWLLELGVDEGLLKKVDPKLNERQTYIFSSLSLMLIVVSFFCFISSVIYTLIIFHNWFIALGVGIFIALTVFNLYRLFVMTALDVSGSSLEEYYINHEKHYDEYVQPDTDYEKFTDASILELTSISKQKLREKSEMDIGDKKNQFSDILTMAFRVIILTIIAMVFATGIELFIFKNQLNEVLEQLKFQYSLHGETWIVDNILTPDAHDQFYIFNTNSLLLAIDILCRGLGFWKIVIDLIFIIIFLLPLILVFKSKEIKQSEYMRELALSEITITFYHFLHTQRICKKILRELESKKIYFTKGK